MVDAESHTPSRMSLSANLRALVLAAAAVMGWSQPAAADFQICNRMSYVVEAALGVDRGGTITTQGWFRIDPGQCNAALTGDFPPADHVYLHARALPVYGGSPIPQTGHVDFCVGEGSFTITRQRGCQAGQRSARFTEVKPTDTEKGPTAILAEEARYDEEQSRLAGIQRLLVIAGYDADPIDGVPGPKTDAALGQFLRDRSLANDTANGSGFFNTLIFAAQHPEGTGFAWCNETKYPVLGAIGLDDKGGIVTRGWYRIEPGKCLRPDMRGQPKRVFSYAEAVDSDNRAIQLNGRPLAWGGTTVLCTREMKFEFSDQKNCEAQGLTASSFGIVDLTGRANLNLRLREP